MSEATRPGQAGHHPGSAPRAAAPARTSQERGRERPDDGEGRPTVPGLRVGRLLGRGGSSSVWLVTDDGDQRFALKVAQGRPPEESAGRTPADDGGRRGRRAARAPGEASPGAPPEHPELHPAAPSGAGAADEVAAELRLLQRFAHDHLVGVHRILETDQGPGLLMDLAPGGSLLALVTSRGPLPIAEVVTALVPIAQVLHHLHGAGALHGDVTPGNILFTHEGKPLLGDFGTGRLLGSDHGRRTGTPGFLDPIRKDSFDTGADVFSLAAVSWFALTGRIPGPTEQRPPLARIIPDVPPQLMQLVEDGLSSDRDRRPTADHFARILMSSAAPEPVNLVPAVHPSVLPELLTRRTDTPSVERVPRRRRLLRGAAGRAPGRTAAARRPPSAGRRASSGRPGTGSARFRRGGQDVRDEPVMRRRFAVAAGLAAVVLLVAGIALTLRDMPGPAAGAGRSAGEEASGPATSLAAPRQAAPQAADDESKGQGAGRRPPAEAAVPEAAVEAALAPDPVIALGGLAALRASAFAAADPAVLARVDVEDSPAMTADRDAVAALAESGTSLRDLSITIRDASLLAEADVAALPVGALTAASAPPASTEVALVRATAALSSYTETGTTAEAPLPGAPPGPLMAAGQQELVFVLWDAGGGWRIHSVVAPPA
ncbi:serine/threonine-protein kinase [Arthrobacter sp. NPDC092385]|uniref:serine/threonine-protein kinase n=1 Tax=Arthrobacter sp. NPDC092385 TaxID=3363943 RepID=UPI003812CF52